MSIDWKEFGKKVDIVLELLEHERHKNFYKLFKVYFEDRAKNQQIIENLEGALNSNFLVRDVNDRKYVLRIPMYNEETYKLIKKEYEGVGYVTNGREYSYRSLEEQVTFSKKCIREGVPVANVISVGQEWMLTEFVEGTTLDKYLQANNDVTIINEHISQIMSSHKKGILIGDRWGPNEIVTNDNKIVYIDFDIELLIEDAKEFEMAQVLYHSIAWSKDKEKTSLLVKDFVKNCRFYGVYDKGRVCKFLRGYKEYFKKDIRYKESEAWIDDLISNMKPQTVSSSIASEKEGNMIYQFKDRMYRICLHPEVAKPDNYTDFLSECIIFIQDGVALDIGTGTGVHAILLRDYYKFMHVDAVDINPLAVRLARQNFALMDLEKNIQVIYAEFPNEFKKEKEYSNDKGKYDLIISAPPDIPTPPSLNMEKNSFYFMTEGGYDGRQVVDKIIREVPLFLKDKGYFQIVHADFIGIEKTCDLMRAVGLKPDITATKKARPGRLTSSRIDYIESLGYKFQRDDEGHYFYLAVITGRKKE